MMVPAWHAPRPLPQASPTPGKVPSSTCPLQLSSMPLQTSGCGVMIGASQVVSVPLALQTSSPFRLQAPTRPLLHFVPTAPVGQLPLSTMPSQLSSRPLHTSAGTAQPQGPPQALGGRPSSIWPLQLSSRQLQVSTAQCFAAVPSRLSGSLGLFDTGHWLDTPSSMRPLQLSSLPLHNSPGGTFWAMIPTSAALTAAVSVSVTK